MLERARGDQYCPGTPERIAQMAELVDALVSGTSVREDVQVRVLFWAPFIYIVLSFHAQVAE